MTDDNRSAGEWLDLADQLFQDRKHKSAVEAYSTALGKAREEFNRSVETEALAQLARVYLKTNAPEEGRMWLDQAGERAAESDPRGWSRYLGVRGRFEWRDNDLEAARTTFNDMYIFCNAQGQWARAVDAAHMLAIVAETTDQQIEWSKRGIEAADAAEAEHLLGPLYNNLAATYYDAEQYDEALKAYLQAREYHWRHSDEYAKLFADYHVGMAYRLVGDLDEAEKWLRPVLAWAERLENHSALGQAAEDLGDILIIRGKKSDGLAMLERARTAYKDAGFDESWPEVWQNINKKIEKYAAES